jgi:hypothetical protein
MRKGKNKSKESNYLVQELDEDIQCEGIPSRILLHLRLAHLIVLQRDEVLEILKLHLAKCSNAKQFGREVVFNMIVLRGPKPQSNKINKSKEK